MLAQCLLPLTLNKHTPQHTGVNFDVFQTRHLWRHKSNTTKTDLTEITNRQNMDTGQGAMFFSLYGSSFSKL